MTFLQLRVADIEAAHQIATQSFRDRSLPSLETIPQSVLATCLTALAFILTVVLAPKLFLRGGKIVVDIIETILAIALLIILIGVLLGLPIGVVYLCWKAMHFLGIRLANLQAIHDLLFMFKKWF